MSIIRKKFQPPSQVIRPHLMKACKKDRAYGREETYESAGFEESAALVVLAFPGGHVQRRLATVVLFMHFRDAPTPSRRRRSTMREGGGRFWRFRRRLHLFEQRQLLTHRYGIGAARGGGSVDGEAAVLAGGAPAAICNIHDNDRERGIYRLRHIAA